MVFADSFQKNSIVDIRRQAIFDDTEQTKRMANAQPLQPAPHYHRPEPIYNTAIASVSSVSRQDNLLNETRPHFCRGVATFSGIMQILTGVSVVTVATLMVTSCVWGYWVGIGFWCGVLFLISGLLSILSARSQSSCSIVFSLISSILSCTFSVVFLTFDTIGIRKDIVGYNLENRGCQPTTTSNRVFHIVNLALVLIQIVFALIQTWNAWRSIHCSQSEAGARPAVNVTTSKIQPATMSHNMPRLMTLPWSPDTTASSSVSETWRLAARPSITNFWGYGRYRMSQVGLPTTVIFEGDDSLSQDDLRVVSSSV